jgi:hypothetical protein
VSRPEYKQAFTVDQTATSITPPSSARQLDLDAGGVRTAAPRVHYRFFGTGADNATASARVTGWNLFGTIYVPTPICTVAIVLGTLTGVAGAEVSDSERWADVLTVADLDTANASVQDLGQNDLIGVLQVAANAYDWLQLQLSVGTATNVNALTNDYWG